MKTNTDSLVAELQARASITQDGPGKHVLRLVAQHLEGKLTRPLAKTKIAKVLCSKMVYGQALVRAETILVLLAEIKAERGTSDDR